MYPKIYILLSIIPIHCHFYECRYNDIFLLTIVIVKLPLLPSPNPQLHIAHMIVFEKCAKMTHIHTCRLNNCTSTWLRALTSALCWRSRLTMLVWPFKTASWSMVEPPYGKVLQGNKLGLHSHCQTRSLHVSSIPHFLSHL